MQISFTKLATNLVWGIKKSLFTVSDQKFVSRQRFWFIGSLEIRFVETSHTWKLYMRLYSKTNSSELCQVYFYSSIIYKHDKPEVRSCLGNTTIDSRCISFSNIQLENAPLTFFFLKEFLPLDSKQKNDQIYIYYMLFCN